GLGRKRWIAPYLQEFVEDADGGVYVGDVIRERLLVYLQETYIVMRRCRNKFKHHVRRCVNWNDRWEEFWYREEKKMENPADTMKAYAEMITKINDNRKLKRNIAAMRVVRMLLLIFQWKDRGSNWRVILVEKHEVDVVHFNPLVGSSFIELPAPLKSNKNGLINIVNTDDDECFRWCHVRHLKPKDKRATEITRSDREFAKTLNYNGIGFPVRIDDIPKIEKANEIRITVIMLKGEKMFFPRYTSKFDYKDHMELLLMEDNEGNTHYVLVRDISMLLSSLSKTQHKRFYCLSCLNGFNSQERLDKHSGTCREVNGTQKTMMPKRGSKVVFKNHKRQLPVQFVIYADFESLLIPVDGEGKCLRKTHDHEMCSYGFKRVCYFDGKYDGEYKSYRGVGAVGRFLSDLLGEVEECNKIIQSEFNKVAIMSVKDYDKLEKAVECHICGGKFSEGDKKVLDHCHVTGKFRGAAHNSCNLNFKLTGKIPVVFHNLRGYDGNFIMQGVAELGEKIEVIANNMQKYMSFRVGKQLVFIDSMQFMSSSLEALVGNLDKSRFKRMQSEWQGEELEMLLKKGVYPYEYMSCWEKFDDKSLPEKSAFYSSLYEEEVNDNDYSRACKVYKKFDCKSLGDYHDLYLKTDVLLLADVFEDFRRVCLDAYKLDPAHYISAPGLSWDAMLKRTGVKLDLLSNVDMYQFIEKGMRGGVSYIGHRYAKANNKYMSDYDPEKPSSYIMYLDANNLYGHAMSEELPYGKFRWIDVDKVKLEDYGKGKEKGLILEVDLEYPSELHKLHSDYPLAPEKMEISDDMSTGVKKLVTTLTGKTSYVCHVNNLKLYMGLGMKLVKIRRAFEFAHSKWLKGYIQFNTDMRTVAKNDFEKNFFKLMNNSVFGKTMENLRKRVDVKLMVDGNKLKKAVASPCFVRAKVLSGGLVAVKKVKEVLLLNKPVYIGMSILDLSKTVMYDFHYNHIRKIYGSRAKLLFTDTDSLMYRLHTDDAYKDAANFSDKYDTSGYNKNSPFYDETNKKVIGKFKDEAGGIPIREFIGLRSKMYSYEKDDGGGGKTAKGVKKYVIKKFITHEDYKRTLVEGLQMKHSMNVIRSNCHDVGTEEFPGESFRISNEKK
ncbi:hypothetical protein AC249_AIPGENE9596, partial [Paramuricea clavata]